MCHSFLLNIDYAIKSKMEYEFIHMNTYEHTRCLVQEYMGVMYTNLKREKSYPFQLTYLFLREPEPNRTVCMVNSTLTTNDDEHDMSIMKTINTKKRSRSNESKDCEFMKGTKNVRRKVSFSNEVEEIPLAQSSHKESSLVKSKQPRQHSVEEKKLIWGKRYTPEEDELIRKAIMDYIEANQLGDQGLYMVLHCQKYKKVRNCWNFIASALPWRPRNTTYLRAHSIFEKRAVSKWEPEQCELLKRCYAQHGPDWKKIAQIFGLSRHQVKDAYRRLMAENLIKGKWKQFEYQSLFDLVNLDLRMKAFQEKKSNHAMIRDNISWQAISVKLSTRAADHCCMKWYARLASPMVKEGRWNDLDDYKMIDAIQKADPSCFEEVDWDNLLEHRSGEICRKRWYEMIKHLDRFWAMPFVDQIDLLSQRYCPDMIPYKEKDLSDHPDLLSEQYCPDMIPCREKDLSNHPDS